MEDDVGEMTSQHSQGLGFGVAGGDTSLDE
jgi:hypothetical protein